MSKQKIVESYKKAHKRAMKKALTKCPQADLNAIIQYAALLMNGDKKVSDLLKDVTDMYGDAAVVYIKESAIQDLEVFLKNSDNEVFQKLGKDKFAKSLINTSEKIFKQLAKYAEGKMTPDQLAVALCKTGVDDVAVKILRGCGIEVKDIHSSPDLLLKLASPMVAYNASIAAYKELRKALDDLELAKEERAIVQAECEESIRMIREYRMEMEDKVSKYLSGYIEVFNDGFAAMDQAIIDNDSDGYIKGNVKIQEALGYNVQFTNQEEFDELMLSDEAFKL